MNNEFVPYEQAVELKELGFDEKCYRGYDKNQMLFYSEQENGHELNYSVGMNVSAPSFSQAFRWFREKYHIIGEVKFKGGKTTKTAWYDYVIYSEIDWNDENPNEQWKKHEEAELACLKKLIEIVKSK